MLMTILNIVIYQSISWKVLKNIYIIFMYIKVYKRIDLSKKTGLQNNFSYMPADPKE